MAKKTSATSAGSTKSVSAVKARETILSLKGTPEWSEWLGNLSAKFRTTKAGIIDRALAEFAQRNEYQEPPER